MVFSIIVAGGNHRKGAFSILLRMRIEMIDGSKRHVDEVISEIECDDENIEVLWPLALKLRGGLLNCNATFFGSMLLCVGTCKNAWERRIFQFLSWWKSQFIAQKQHRS